jgi:hypothetical protein
MKVAIKKKLMEKLHIVEHLIRISSGYFQKKEGKSCEHFGV